MSMTKTDYELIAFELASIHTSSGEQTETWQQICEQLADAFGNDNPRFDHNKFLTACGIKE